MSEFKNGDKVVWDGKPAVFIGPVPHKPTLVVIYQHGFGSRSVNSSDLTAPVPSEYDRGWNEALDAAVKAVLGTISNGAAERAVRALKRSAP